MKYELTHDSVAAQIVAKISNDTKARRDVEAKVLSAGLMRYRKNKGKGGGKDLLTEDELELIKPYESVIRFSDEETILIQKSKDYHTRQALRRRLLTFAIIAVLALATIVSLYLWQEAKQAARAAQSAEFAAKAEQALAAKNYADALQFAYQSLDLKENATATQVLASAFHQHHLTYAPLSIGAFWYAGKAIKKAAIAPDQKYILTITADSTAWLVAANLFADPKNPNQNHLIKKLKGYDLDFQPQFSPNGTYFILQRADYQLERHEVGSEKVDILRGHTDYVQEVKFSPDGARIVSCGSDGKVEVYDKNGDYQQTIRQTDKDRVMAIQFFDNGKRLVSFGEQDSVETYDFDTKTVSRTTKENYGAIGVSDDKILTINAMVSGKAVQFRSTASQDLIAQVTHEAVKGTAFSADGSMILTFSDDGWARLWRQGAPNAFYTEGGYFGETVGVFDDKDGRVLTLYPNEQAKILDKNIKILNQLDTKENIATRAHWSPDGKMILLQHDRNVSVWTAEGRLLTDKISSAFEILNTQFTPDSKMILASFDDTTGIAAAYYGLNGQEQYVLKPNEKLSVFDFSPNGKAVISGGWSGSVRIHDRVGEMGRVIFQSSDLIKNLSGSSDGRSVLVLARGEKGDDLMQLQSGSENLKPKILAANVNRVWFSPNKQLMVLEFENSLELRSTEGVVLYQFAGLPHRTSTLMDIRFSADGARVILHFDGGKAQTWYTPEAMKAIGKANF